MDNLRFGLGTRKLSSYADFNPHPLRSHPPAALSLLVRRYGYVRVPLIRVWWTYRLRVRRTSRLLSGNSTLSLEEISGHIKNSVIYCSFSNPSILPSLSPVSETSTAAGFS